MKSLYRPVNALTPCCMGSSKGDLAYMGVSGHCCDGLIDRGGGDADEMFVSM